MSGNGVLQEVNRILEPHNVRLVMNGNRALFQRRYKLEGEKTYRQYTIGVFSYKTIGNGLKDLTMKRPENRNGGPHDGWNLEKPWREEMDFTPPQLKNSEITYITLLMK